MITQTNHTRFFIGLLVFFSLLTLHSSAQQKNDPIRFRGGAFRGTRNIANARALHDSLEGTQFKDHQYALIQFDRIPDKTQQQQLRDNGVRLFDYLPGKAYLAEITGEPHTSILKDLSVSGLYKMPAEFKIHTRLQNRPIATASGQVIGISWFGTLSEKEVMDQLHAAGATIVPTRIRPTRTLFITANPSSLRKIAAMPFVGYIGPQSIKEYPLNNNNRATHGIDALSATGGRNLQGDGVVVGIGDNGDPYTHIDFTGRQIDRFAAVPGDHGVHTSGTLAGAGILDPRYKGMAPHVTFISQYFSDILVNSGTYIGDYNMVLTNNSYTAYNPGCEYDGQYDFYSYYMDGQAAQYPNLLHTFAAGNDGIYDCVPYALPYASIKSGFQAAKNVLDVGNIDNVTEYINTYSSCGPVDDGRIKPDIVAGGNNIWSTLPYNNYGPSSGTSMSSPTVTGALALVVQRYRQLHANADPPAALLKTLVCNNATDWGSPGPDFMFGFGSLNARATVEAMENNNYTSASIANAGSNQFTITGVPAGLRQIKIMLYWPDYPASPYAATTLVNNLDLTVSGSDAIVHRPLILNPDPAHVTDPAVEGVDNRNNIEQVVIDNPPAGNFTVTVTGTNVPVGPQTYYIAWQSVAPSVTLQYPYGEETFVPGETENIRWTAFGGETNTFTLEYSTDNGGSWNTIDNAISGTVRHYGWLVPAIATTQARIRITRNNVGYTDQSHGVFAILGQPALTLTNPCQGYAKLRWNKIPAATAYDIMQLTGDSMVKIVTTTDTTYLLANLRRDSSYWLSVRALDGTTVGRRSIAANIIPSSGPCNLTELDNDMSVDSLILPTGSGRQHTSTELGSATLIRIECKNLGTIPTAGSYTLNYRVNGGSVVSETGSTTIAPNGVINYTFNQTLDCSAPGVYRIETWIAYPSDPQKGNDTLVTSIAQLANDPVTLNPTWTEGFEAAAPASYTRATKGLTGIDRFDFSASDANGRARTFINTGFARSGNRCATLDQQYYGVATTTDSLIATLNLSAYSASDQIWLNFFYRNQGIDSSFPGNAVWIRGNDQAPWLPAFTLDTDPTKFGLYQPSPNIDVRHILGAATPAQSVSSSFQIKFGQQGHTSANSVTIDGNLDDGYSFDDIVLTRTTSDAAILSIQAPSFTDICGLTNAETVSVKVRNYSATPIANIPVTYSINGTAVTESIPLIAAGDSIVYTFSHTADLSAFREYTIQAWVSAPADTYHYNDTLQPIRFRTSPVITSYPYLENFETGDGNWYTGGVNSSWQWGTPAKPGLNRAASGTKCWATSLNGNYNDNERSYLYSPCLDLSSLNHPMLSFSHSFRTEDDCDCDYHWVEYSTDDLNWYRLGAVSYGTNWYDNVAHLAWQHSDTVWRVASYEIPYNASKVRLRIVMSSDPATNYPGVAIDDIHISEKVPVYSGANISGLSQSVSGTGWIDFDMGGKRIVSLNSHGQNLGSTTVRVFVNAGPVRNDSVQYYLDRNIVIQPATAPTAPVSVRFYFTDSEVRALTNATGCATCTTLADAYQAGITQYSSPVATEEDSTLSNDSSGVFHFLLPRQAVSVIPYDNGYYAEYQVGGFSEFWINNGGPGGDQALPINLLSFTAVRNGSTALLTWSTSAQMDAGKFIIGKSKDGSLFRDIDSVNAQLNGQSQTYNYTDPRLGPGTSWYRLRMIDADGHTSWSPIRILSDSSGSLRISLYPNPIHTGNVYVRASSPIQWVRMTDAGGKTILQAKGQSSLLAIPVTGLAPGIYFLSIDTEAGSEVRKLFVK